MRGRPCTDSPKDVKISVRLDSETMQMIEKKKEGTMSDYIRERIIGEAEMPGWVSTIVQLSKDSRMKEKELVKEINRLMDSGELMSESGKLVVHENGVDLTFLMEACHSTGSDPQKAINETTQRILKGR